MSKQPNRDISKEQKTMTDGSKYISFSGLFVRKVPKKWWVGGALRNKSRKRKTGGTANSATKSKSKSKSEVKTRKLGKIMDDRDKKKK